MNLTLKFECPSCGKSFDPIPLMKHATTFHVRTCRRCRERWRLRVAPREWNDAIISVGELTFLGRFPAKAQQ